MNFFLLYLPPLLHVIFLVLHKRLQLYIKVACTNDQLEPIFELFDGQTFTDSTTHIPS